MHSSENIKPDSAIEREPGSRPKSELEGGTTFLGSWWEKQVQEFQREVKMRENELVFKMPPKLALATPSF